MSPGDHRWDIYPNANRTWKLLIGACGDQQSSGLYSMVFSLLSEAEKMQTSPPSAGFPPCLCGPACPCPLLHHSPVTLCPAPKDSPYSHWGPTRTGGTAASWQPTASYLVLCSLVIFTALFIRSLQDGAGFLQAKRQESVLAVTHTSHWHSIMWPWVLLVLFCYLCIWCQNLTGVNLQVSYA